MVVRPDAASRVAAVLLIALVITWAAPPHRAAGAVIDDFAYPDDAAARAAWRPMAGSPHVEPAPDKDGRSVLRLPCDFTGIRDLPRASWDHTVRLDLTAARGLRFRVRCADAAPVGSFSIYFQSGDGWYRSGFAPEGGDGWTTVEILKEDTSIEGAPAGWGQIRTIRISAWRGGDGRTDLLLSDLETIDAAGTGGDAAPLVYIIRGESVTARDPGEAESVARFAQSVAQVARALGLNYSVISDLDLTAPRLQDAGLVVLPHNPGMAEAPADALADYVRDGGKLMAFYHLPSAVAGAAGFRMGRFVPGDRPGAFASIRFVDGEGAPAGAPGSVEQRSWNVNEAAPVDGSGARVVAWWHDDAGAPTPYPAVLASDRAVLMTHVLLGDGDPAAKRRMVLALAGHLVPELWPQATGYAIAQAGRIGPYDTFDAAAAGIRSRADADEDAAADEIASATAHLRRARQHAAQDRYAGALDAADAARRALVRAYCIVQPSKPGEFRGAWVHTATGPAGMGWDAAIQRLADNGFTAVIPNMLWGGVAFYESDVLPVSPVVAEQGDQIAACLAAAQRHGLAVHVWKVNWNMGGHAPQAFVDRMNAEGRTQVSFDGTRQERWLCPSDPRNQRLEIDSLIEVATRYDVDGIHFDYIRYPDADHCFCAGCRGRFQRRIRRSVERWPQDVRSDPELSKEWLDFRRDNITAVVAAVAEHVHAHRPGMKVSAAVFRSWPTDRDAVGQDWRLWCDRGWLDFVCPMDYTESNGQLQTWARQQVEWAGDVPCYPGIGLSVWPSLDVVKLIDQIAITRDAGAGGFTVFEYQRPEADNIIPLLGLGTTRREGE